tara:strand:+ start:871 stop:1080 length:210 start_codon:yes stop_codon:yes gene_type:complete
MKRLLLPLLAVLALPTAVNATNYLECEAIFQALERQSKILMKDLNNEKQNKIFERIMKDAKKRGCYYIQ